MYVHSNYATPAKAPTWCALAIRVARGQEAKRKKNRTVFLNKLVSELRINLMEFFLGPVLSAGLCLRNERNEAKNNSGKFDLSMTRAVNSSQMPVLPPGSPQMILKHTAQSYSIFSR